MRTTRFPSRAFERTLRSPPFRDAEGEAGAEGDQPARQFYYLRLMRVSIRHNYYYRSNGECPDFSIRPTSASAALMQTLGLLFKDEVTGFSILYDVRRRDILLSYLRRQEWPPKSNHCWTRLSFVLSLKNPYFLNFTDLPIDLNPANQNFYFTNQNARLQRDQIVLNPDQEQELLRVVPVQFGVPVSNAVKDVEVQDVAQVAEAEGAVICRPRCIPDEMLKTHQASQVTCKQVEEYESKHPIPLTYACMNKIYLDFSPLPEDKYTIKHVYILGSPAPPPPAGDGPVLYTESYPVPLCFINLFFTNPTGEKLGFFPVRHLFSEKPRTTVETVNYELKFERRSTYWNYFIVPQSGEDIENLRIEPEVRFNGPCSVNLPDGRKAYRFVSKQPLPFIQQSQFRFRLTGELGATAQNSILMERLPVASPEQVLQDELTACLKLDGSVRPGAKTECRKLKGQICRCVCMGLPVDKWLQVLKGLCADPQNPTCQELRLKLRCPKIYSDIYVYV